MFRQYFVITLHAILTLAAYTAWSWLDYRIVIVLAALHFIILEILQGVSTVAHAIFRRQRAAIL